MENPSYDVLIIGSGIAGISCALELLAQNKTVLLLDRDTPQNLGGLAKESFGGLLMVGTPEQRRAKIDDTPERALRDWFNFGQLHDETPATHWPRQWAEHYVNDSRTHLYDWLTAQGIRFLPLPLWVERGLVRNGCGAGNSVPRWHVVWGTGAGLIHTLIARLNAHPNRARLTMQFGCKVERLLSAQGRVTGCAGVYEAGHEKVGQTFEVQAEHVVIAAGGINGGDLSMARQHWHPDWGAQAPATLLNGSHRFADGTLHQAAQAVGGQLTHLQNQWNYAGGIRHWKPRKPGHGLSLVPPKSALWLNWRGQRILPPLVSGFDTRDLVTQICAQGPGYSWQVMNRKIALKELAISGAEFNPSVRDIKKLAFLRDLLLGNHWLLNEVLTHSTDVVVAHSLPELAAKMNALQGDASVQPAQLQDAVAQYDAEVARGAASTDGQRLQIAELRQWRGDRLRTCKAAPIMNADALPLIAIREHIISRKSLGGIQTDLQCRVQDASGQPISGLYAIGEAAGFGGGGINGLRGLEGTFLGGCIYSGRRAAWAMR